MIIARSPLRISLGGGGTDLPSFYRRRGGFLLAAAIDKYVYITVHDTFVDDLIVKYSKLERVSSFEEVEHPIVREALRLVGIHGRALEIASMADIPAGTGLGSSGSFTTALLKALHAHQKQMIQPRDIAEQACHLEIDVLQEHVGKQDQYIAAFGGVSSFTFNQDDSVEVRTLPLATDVLYELEDSLLLFFTGYSRSASTVLKDENTRITQGDADVDRNLTELKDIAVASQSALQSGDLTCFGRLLSEQWEQKKRRSSGVSNNLIDDWYAAGMANGAIGGKLVGAGGGGFLLFYAENRTQLRRTMSGLGLPEVRFRFEFEGTQVVVQS
jgi:D-glycero-alpha-D-manno-heptose-7-phosphate kinase